MVMSNSERSNIVCSCCRAGKIAVDPTSDEEAGVELNQKTQLGSSGTSGVSAYPTLNGQKVHSSPPCCTPASCSKSWSPSMTNWPPRCMRNAPCNNMAA